MKKTLFLVGPTASGKTVAGLHLAKKFSCEILSADSMLVYKGLNIGTAKPSPADLKVVLHHLIDIRQPDEEFSVFDYRKLALREMDAIQSRGKLPLVVGGSGLYIKSLLDGLAPQPGKQDSLRGQLEKGIQEEGLEPYYQMLSERDPKTASRIKPQDERRIIRALEVCLSGDKTPSEHRQKQETLEELGFNFLLLGLTWKRMELYERCEKRVDQMINKGLEKEIRSLDYHHFSKTAAQAVGYKEMIAFLNNHLSREEAIDLIKKNTRHLVKKQLTWFRKEKRIRWFNGNEFASEKDLFGALTDCVQEWLQK